MAASVSASTVEKKSAPVVVRRVPGVITTGILIFLLLAVVFLRLSFKYVEVGGLDEAAANLGTYVAIILAAIVCWAWFCFRSTYAPPLRIAAIVCGLIVAIVMVRSVRLEGITGNWIPTGVRWSWQKSRDYDRAKPMALTSANSAATAPGDAALEEEQIIASTPDDFPQFLGPHRDGYLPDVQLSHDWESTPPKELWRKEVGAGWSGYAVVASRAVTMEQYGDEEVISCCNLDHGKPFWSYSVTGRHEEFMGGIGPRCTPTLHESKVYSVGATGVVTCLELGSGRLVWQDDLRKRFDVSAEEDLKRVMWGRSNSPLIYHDLCIVPAGGKAPISLIAYDKNTGKRRWEGGSTQISYASPTIMNIGGKDQVVSVNESNVTGHNPETGQLLWSFDWPGRSNMNASASQPHLLAENRIFISKGYDEGAAVYQIAELGGEYRAELVWKDKRLMQTKFTNAVVVGNYAYGLTDGILQCIDLRQGKKQWTAGRYGHGQILAVGDVLLVQTEKTGELVMLALDPEKHRELGKVKTLSTQSQSWNNLCLAGKHLLLRNADEAVCFELP